MNILLDMDGVLSDFLRGAVRVCNDITGKNYTVREYATTFGRWGIDEFYGITVEEMWIAIEKTPDFWLNLNKLPWADELYDWLSSIGDVTIVSTPSFDPDCARQKLEWLRWFGIKPNDVFLGSKKFLMAGNGILIDDWSVNCEKFSEAGGRAIMLPSNWNTIDLDFCKIKTYLEEQLRWAKIPKL